MAKKGNRTVHCAFCGLGGHQSNVCPYAGPDNPSMVDVIMKETGGSKFSAYNTLERERKAGIDSWAKRGLARPGPRTDVPTKVANHKRAILEALDTFPRKEARSIGVLLRAVQTTGFWSDTHNIAHVIWSLQKEGAVRFTERKGAGGVSVLDHIAMRPVGYAKLIEMRNGKTDEQIETERAIVVGQAVLEKILTEPAEIPVEPIRVTGADDASPVNEEALGPLEPEVVIEQESQEAPPEVHDKYHDYPLIAALEDRRVKVESAAQLLADAGMDELALEVLERLTYTDFEKEVLKLWSTLE